MHEMRKILVLAARHLSQPLHSELLLDSKWQDFPKPYRSSSTFTTFDSLTCDAIYFRGELPLETKLLPDYVADFAWAALGPIPYGEIAHVLIPRFFTQEISVSERVGEHPNTWNEWKHEQDINGLSKLFNEARIEHHLADQVLEVRRF